MFQQANTPLLVPRYPPPSTLPARVRPPNNNVDYYRFFFLIAQSFDDSLHAMRGSVPWMAPEMIKQSGHGRSADVWSVGATLIEMCTARYPWPPFSNNMAAMYHVATATEVRCKIPVHKTGTIRLCS